MHTVSLLFIISVLSLALAIPLNSRRSWIEFRDQNRKELGETVTVLRNNPKVTCNATVLSPRRLLMPMKCAPRPGMRGGRGSEESIRILQNHHQNGTGKSEQSELERKARTLFVLPRSQSCLVSLDQPINPSQNDGQNLKQRSPIPDDDQIAKGRYEWFEQWYEPYEYQYGYMATESCIIYYPMEVCELCIYTPQFCPIIY